MNHIAAMFHISCDSIDTSETQCVHSVFKHFNIFKRTLYYKRFHYVKLKLSASDAIVTAISLPITLHAIWLTTSGITGLTFPGIIDEPGCIGGKLISPIPVRGPRESSLRSLQIFDSLTARRLMVEEYITKSLVSCVASIKFFASFRSNPVISLKCSKTIPLYSGSALMPVPIAVSHIYFGKQQNITFKSLNFFF